MLHMLQELPVSTIPFKNGKRIKSVHILGKDYFGAVNAKRDQAISTEILSDTACVQFDDGSLEIVDLDFGCSVKVGIEPVKSVSLTPTGELCILTTDNRLVNIEVQHSIPSFNRDFTEELLISLLSTANNTKLSIDTNAHISTKLVKLVEGTSKLSVVEDALDDTFAWGQSKQFGLEQLAWIWSLIRADPLVRGHAVLSVAPTLATNSLFNSHHSPGTQQAQL